VQSAWLLHGLVSIGSKELEKVLPMLSDKPVITIENLSKSYHMYATPQDRLKQFLFGKNKKYYREFWALHPLTLDINSGQCIGIIGRNGSGKSTLLQIISGILNPTSGSVSVKGRLVALLELGAGFNPEFTGRENVIINAMLLGLSQAQVMQRFPSIIDFSEIGSFIDQPVKTYSSGMYIRLAFAVAMHVDPDVLIVDEALSVGDAAFQYKCMRRIEELKKGGMTILFVTHDTGAIRRFCDYAYWVHEGRIIADGTAVEVANQYDDFILKQIGDQNPPAPALNVAEPDVIPAQDAAFDGPHGSILHCELDDARGVNRSQFLIGGDLELTINYQVNFSPPEGLMVGAAVFRSDNLYVCGLNTAIDKVKIESAIGKHQIKLQYPKLKLLPGSYYFKVGIFDSSGMVKWDFHHNVCPFVIAGPYLAEGVYVIDHLWKQ
jgi:teichoic acid transport system ATP-binding protein